MRQVPFNIHCKLHSAQCCIPGLGFRPAQQRLRPWPRFRLFLASTQLLSQNLLPHPADSLLLRAPEELRAIALPLCDFGEAAH